MTRHAPASREPAGGYYPPRAPWYRGIREAGYTLLAMTRINRLRSPEGISLLDFVRGLLIPGWAFLHRRRLRVGRVVFAGWLLSLFAGVAFIGYWPMVLFVGLAIGLHASSVVYLVSPFISDSAPPFRLLANLTLSAGLILFGYLPAQRLIERFLFFPLRSDDGVVVVHPGRNAASVRRGDCVAYRVDEGGSRQVVIHGGLNLAPVLAMAGDSVTFRPGVVEVNGRALPREPDMPAEGGLTVPAGCWFIWPRFRTVRWVNVDQHTISEGMTRSAIVGHEALVGRPFNHWFFRRQPIP